MGSALGFQTRRELLLQMVPRYRKASVVQKGALLDEIVATTGYARRYAMWLLNHCEELQPAPRRRRQRTFGPEVQRALFLVWQAANQICTKRLMPYLPTHIEALERHGHLHLTDACRSQLLSMSAATADRLLRGPRTQGPRGFATTRAGTLLKQQISIRTFEQWNETQPGFLEVDVVAHCGSQPKGHFLSTLTFTDIATGWTECFPLLTKSAKAVVSAFQQARACFPFPILGLDTDNGCEFINEYLLAYCEQEAITFTRGRPDVKNDQCHVEQKNGAIVRQVVGYARLEGERAYRQLDALYQALRLYVNGFQPSMKLQANVYDGRKVRRIYDAAKTPLQRLLLSHLLPASKEHEVQQVAQVLDLLRFFSHLQYLQQGLIGCITSASSGMEGISSAALLPFCIERCIGTVSAATSETQEGAPQKQAIPVFAHDPVLSRQPEHDAQSTTPSRGQGTRSAHVTPSQRPEEEDVFPSQPIGEEKETICPLAPANGDVAQGVSTQRSGSLQSHTTLVENPSTGRLSTRFRTIWRIRNVTIVAQRRWNGMRKPWDCFSGICSASISVSCSMRSRRCMSVAGSQPSLSCPLLLAFALTQHSEIVCPLSAGVLPLVGPSSISLCHAICRSPSSCSGKRCASSAGTRGMGAPAPGLSSPKRNRGDCRFGGGTQSRHSLGAL